MTARFFTLIVLFTATSLSGCGFHLRGSVTLPPELQALYLEGPVGGSDIVSELRRVLQSRDIELLDQPDPDGYRLQLGNEEITERVLSVNANARDGEYELSVSVAAQLRSGNAVVFGPEILTAEKIYVADPNNAVAKAEERELMEGEMRRELVSRVLRRLQNADL